MFEIILGGLFAGLTFGVGVRIGDEIFARYNEYRWRQDQETALRSIQDRIQQQRAQAQVSQDPLGALREYARQTGGQVVHIGDLPMQSREEMLGFLQNLGRAIREGRMEEVTQKLPGVDPEKVQDVMNSIKDILKTGKDLPGAEELPSREPGANPWEKPKAEKVIKARIPKIRKSTPNDPAGDGTFKGPDGA